MPHIDRRTGEVVLRIVYDGAPEAGKTTNVQRLGGAIPLQRRGATASPGTTGPRTEFFDWLDFMGGYIDGRRVRCQLVTVPGQPALLHRRRYLLDTADAVVFVVDSSPFAVDAAAPDFETTRRLVRAAERRIPVGVVVQANKQDLEGALAPHEVVRRLGGGNDTPAVPGIAERGDGVMQTFVLAVRLATDRVKGLLVEDRVEELDEAILEPDVLHALMVASEAPTTEPAEAAVLAAERRLLEEAAEQAEQLAEEEARVAERLRAEAERLRLEEEAAAERAREAERLRLEEEAAAERAREAERLRLEEEAAAERAREAERLRLEEEAAAERAREAERLRLEEEAAAERAREAERLRLEEEAAAERAREAERLRLEEEAAAERAREAERLRLEEEAAAERAREAERRGERDATKREAMRLALELAEAEHAARERIEAERIWAERLTAHGRARAVAAQQAAVAPPSAGPRSTPRYSLRGNRIGRAEQVVVPAAHEVLSGHLWPPVRGRAALAIATGTPLRAPSTLAPWAPQAALEVVSELGWTLHSSEAWDFSSEADGRRALHALARSLVPLAWSLPEGRALVLARDAERWRLWMVSPPLVSLEEALDGASPDAVARLRKQLEAFLLGMAAATGRGEVVPGGLSGLAQQDGRVVLAAVAEEGLPEIDPRTSALDLRAEAS